MSFAAHPKVIELSQRHQKEIEMQKAINSDLVKAMEKIQLALHNSHAMSKDDLHQTIGGIRSTIEFALNKYQK